MQEGLREFGSHQNHFSVHLTQSVTLKIDTLHLSELEQTQTTWCQNAKSYHHWNNNQEGLKS